MIPRASAALICAISIGAFAADLWFLDFLGPRYVVAALPLLSLAIVGSVLIVRRVGGPIGWLLGAAGALLQLVLLLQAYGSASLETGVALPSGELALWLGSVIAIVPFGLVICAMVLFPDGRPQGRAFAILLWAFAAFVVINVVVSALADRPILVAPPSSSSFGDIPRSITNPFALHGPIGDLLLLVSSAISTFLPLVLIAPLALLFRFRRSRGVERQQLKWLTYAGAVTFGLLLIPLTAPSGPITSLAAAAALFGVGLLPVAIGIAIMRYHLYDIDVLINRTLVYGATSAAIAASFFIGIVALQALLRPLTAGSEIAIAGSTLVSFALFQRVRRGVQSAVDRRFDRSRYDAALTLDVFADQLRDEVELETVRSDLIQVIHRTMSPSHVGLWLRLDRRAVPRFPPRAAPGG